MDTFPIVKRKDEAAHGEYRTKRVILEVYDAMHEAGKFELVGVAGLTVSWRRVTGAKMAYEKGIRRKNGLGCLHQSRLGR